MLTSAPRFELRKLQRLDGPGRVQYRALRILRPASASGLDLDSILGGETLARSAGVDIRGREERCAGRRVWVDGSVVVVAEVPGMTSRDAEGDEGENSKRAHLDLVRELVTDCC